ncbi:hypothetical protein V0U79_02165 [Hyphobacterium sp. HN65]|uniref:JmjC domain-containing protein n=1 Tax=Hyphobacterium lacteum TaxID=3116575 RepID=A0ABU7LMM8_9PROT|nr:hypothetical protein [Hyphobacterium sp. HN65]MEE2525154.1 hypothetical protein [Hyphobacterium sp. HN65]
MIGTGETQKNAKVVTEWGNEAQSGFRKKFVVGQHDLHTRPEFSDEALAALIERHPADLIDFCTMGELDDGADSWRTGDPGDLSGMEVLEAVRAGKLWINLREAMSVDPVYRPLYDQMLADMKANNPGYKVLSAESGILISSPTAQVFIHSDPSETILWHVRGKKRFRVYPAEAPYVTEERLEAILHKETTEDLPFEPSWDNECEAIDLEPGMFASWPLHGPHRVQNLSGMNVSVTMEIVTPESMLRNGVLHANGVLRRRFGITPRSTDTSGPAAYLKIALSRMAKVIWRNTKPLPVSERTFDIDGNSPTGFRDRAA